MILPLLAGLVILVAGAEILVRGSSRIAGRLGISRLVVGLTVVAFGTSAPEVTVSVGSALAGQADLALGNVVGSNIFNVLFILGVSTLVTPLVVSSKLVRWDVPLGILVSLVAFGLAADGTIGRVDGVLLFAGLLAYVAVIVREARSGSIRAPETSGEGAGETDSLAAESEAPSGGVLSWLLDLTAIVGGLALLVAGAQWFLGGAVELASLLGLSELVIGLTIVAGGTSLPELATSVLASVRGERDIAVGNVVGSNLFNLLGVLGISAAVAPTGVPVSEAAFWFDLPVMIAVAVACWPIFATGHRISRWEGGLFVAYYGVYISYLVLAAGGHAAAAGFGTAMLFFVIPLTGITIGVTWYRWWKRDVPADEPDAMP